METEIQNQVEKEPKQDHEKKEGIIKKVEKEFEKDVKIVGEEVKKIEKGVIKEVKKVEKGVEKIIHKIEGKETHEETAEEEAEHKKEEAIEKSHSKKHSVKEKDVNNLAKKIKNAKTLMIVSIKGLPSKQFQEIKKSIREHALVRVAKKNIMLRSIKAIGKESILKLKEHIQENSAFVISDIEGYELAGILSQKKNPVYARAGQEAPEDINVSAGPTDLVPGPAISELGSVGLQIAVENGKISIKAGKVIVKKGEEISENVASILQKLNIQPFTVGLEPVVIYNISDGKIYTDIKINSEETANDLKNAAGKALGFAQKIVYYCKETIGYLLAKANANNQSLGKLAPVEEKPAEEKSEESDTEKKEEQPAEAKPTEQTNETPAEKPKEETQIKSEEEK